MSSQPPSLGKYQVLEEIGRGGMGAVYKGHDPLLNRTVAIKLLAPHLVWEKSFVERFMREARSVAQLRHPNIIDIYDVGQDGDNYYFVMAYLPGASLRQFISQQGRLSPAESLRILQQLAEALDYAHSKGLVHRDVKPANVMFDERQQAVLTDFGIVKAAEESRLTGTGASIGTPHYMAPEQVQGTSVDARTDEYALGIIAFEMLAGRVPFDAGTTTAILFKQVHEPPPSVLAFCPDLPPSVEGVVQRALAKLPSERYATCGEFVAALAQALAIGAPQPIERTQLVRPKQKQAAPPMQAQPGALLRGLPVWVWAGLATAVLVGVVILAISTSWLGTRHFTPTPIAVTQQTAAPVTRPPTMPIQPGTVMAAAPVIATIQATNTPSALAAAAPSSTVQIKPLALYEGSAPNFAWSPDNKFLILATYGDLQLLDAPALTPILKIKTSGSFQAVFSRDGKSLATRSSDGVKLWDTASWSEARSLAGSKNAQDLALSPDGKRLVVALGSAVKVWDTASGQELLTLPAGESVRAVTFSPDGQVVASASYNNIKLWDAASGKEQLALQVQSGPINSITFSPNGEILAGSVDDTIHLWSMPGGRALRAIVGHTKQIRHIAFSPDGQWLASASDDLTIKVWDIASGQELRALIGHANPVERVAFSPNGGMLASGSSDQLRLWSVQPGNASLEPSPTPRVAGPTVTPAPLSAAAISIANAKQVAQLHLIETSRATQAFWLADGKSLLAIAGYNSPVIDSTTLEQIREIQFGGASQAALSPDGALLAIAGVEKVELWDTSTWSMLHTLPASSFAAGIAFSPDGTLVAGAIGQAIRVWDATSAQELLTIPVADTVRAIAFSPDGQTIASGSVTHVKLWDASGGQERLEFKGQSGTINTLSFSPDGQTLATGSYDKTIILWSVANGRQVHTLSGHTERITHVAFSPDGQLLASASADLAVKLWQVAGGQELTTLIGHSQQVNWVSFSPDGSLLATTADDGSVRLWGVR